MRTVISKGQLPSGPFVDIVNDPEFHCLQTIKLTISSLLLFVDIISDESTRQREFGPLEKIRDNHPKYVISATPLLIQRDENGITHLSLRKFLKEGI